MRIILKRSLMVAAAVTTVALGSTPAVASDNGVDVSDYAVIRNNFGQIQEMIYRLFFSGA